MTPISRKHLPRPLVLGLAATVWLSACSNLELSDKVDYRTAGARNVTLDVPPDLSQLPEDARFGVAAGEPVLASRQSNPAAAAPAASTPTAVAPNPVGNATLVRRGDQRWILTKDSPETVWPRLEQFLTDSGLTLRSQDPTAGVIETDWAENRVPLKHDAIRAAIGRFFANAYESGLRDRYTARVERTPEGTEIYLAHHGLEEVYVDRESRDTRWQPRASDPALEAVLLQRLLAKLGPDAQAPAERTEARPAARAIETGVSTPTLEFDDSLANTWRRVSVALDRAGYTTVSRDRRKALLTVQVPAEKADKPKGFLARIFSSDAEEEAAKAQAAGLGPKQRLMFEEVAPNRTRLSVLNTDGQPDRGDKARALADGLLKALK